MEDTITTERIERYLAITAEARAKATPSTSSQEDEEVLRIMLQMCDAYATDSRHFRDLAPDIYRFSGVRVKLADVKGAHGTDERIGVASYAAAVRILAGIIRHGAG